MTTRYRDSILNTHTHTHRHTHAHTHTHPSDELHKSEVWQFMHFQSLHTLFHVHSLIICHVKCICFEAFPSSCSLNMSLLKHFLSYRNSRVQICEVKVTHLVLAIFIRFFTGQASQNQDARINEFFVVRKIKKWNESLGCVYISGMWCWGWLVDDFSQFYYSRPR